MIESANGVLVVNEAMAMPDIGEKARAVLEKLQVQIQHCERSGMAAMAKAVREKAQRVTIDAVLRTMSMRLIKIARYADGNCCLVQFDTEGTKHPLVVNSYDRYWRKSPLSKWTGNIPDSILEKIPGGLADRAVIFEAYRDPIIAIPIKNFQVKWFQRTKYYGAVFYWE